MMMKATAAGRPRTEDETSRQATRIAWVWGDLLDLALESVDYHQIAADLLADVSTSTK